MLFRNLLLSTALSCAVIVPSLAVAGDGPASSASLSDAAPPTVAPSGGLPPVFEALKRKERGEPTPPLPPSMARYGKAFDYAGKLGGLDAWSLSGGPVFAVLPDGKTVIMGVAIAPDGKDQTPDYTGAGAVDVEGFMRAAAGERERAEKARAAARAQASTAPAEPVAPAKTGSDQRQPRDGYDPAKAAAALREMLQEADAGDLDPRVRALIEETLKKSARSSDASPPAPRGDGPALAVAVLQPEKQKSAADVSRGGQEKSADVSRGGQEKFADVSRGGQEKSADVSRGGQEKPAGDAKVLVEGKSLEFGKSADAGRAGDTVKAGDAGKLSGSVKSAEDAKLAANGASAPSKAGPVITGDGPANSDDAKALRAALESVAWRTSWIVVGNRDPKTPVIYVFADPTCPHCVAGFGRLRDFVDHGKLQLRVVLAPYLSQESLDLATAVLRAENPGEAFWKLETERAAHNRNGIAPMPAKTYLDPERLAALDRNIKWFSEHALAGTPFYLWREEGGARVLYGEPDVRNFYGALPDDVVGVEGEWRPAPERKAAPAPEDPATPASGK